MEKIKVQLEKVTYDNNQLREEISALKAVLKCKNEEFHTLEKKFNDQ